MQSQDHLGSTEFLPYFAKLVLGVTRTKGIVYTIAHISGRWRLELFLYNQSLGNCVVLGNLLESLTLRGTHLLTGGPNGLAQRYVGVIDGLCSGRVLCEYREQIRTGSLLSLFCARHCSKHLAYINSFNPHNSYNSHSTDEDIEAREH